MTAPTVYTGDGWEVRSGRWQDSPPDVVDVVISDPPYDARTHKGGRRGKFIEGDRATGLASQIDEPAPKGFDPIDAAAIGPPLVEIARRWVVLFCAAEQLGDHLRANGKNYCRGGIWLKTNPTPQFSGDRPGQWGDGIAILHRKGRKRWARGGSTGAWIHATIANFGREIRQHETQKPLPLMLDLVRDFSEPGELVWDPYCGSGTTGVACLRLGRRFLGHEMQPHYAEIAAQRLEAETRGLTLVDVRQGQTSILDRMTEPAPELSWLEKLTQGEEG